jgi:hypothetical protein
MIENLLMPLKPRQAVVIIHGVGEQRPMDTLRAFVKVAAGRSKTEHGDVEKKAFSKPDSISPTLELRRMAIPGDNREWREGDWVATDFYELYWAHLMTGTSWRHVMAWARTVLFRRPWNVPSRLIWPWMVSWVLLLIGAGVYGLVALRGWMDVSRWPLILILIPVVVPLIRKSVNYVGLGYLGDAARYLSPTPANVAVRQAIRSAAIDLLEGLHDDPTWRRYHRIVLVGHSLGSVIGYDALTHLWQRRHHPPSTQPLELIKQPILEKYEKIREAPTSMTDTPRELQSALWREQRQVGIQWKITDFVTLGSPLAHARFLMAANKEKLEERISQREYPSCPPQPNDPRDSQYGESLLKTETNCKLLHHAALFACTRWTNLYFKKDFIGGPIDDLGDWIDNKLVPPYGLFPHTRYWRGKVDLTALRAALELTDWWTAKNPSVVLAVQEREAALLNAEHPAP